MNIQNDMMIKTYVMNFTNLHIGCVSEGVFYIKNKKSYFGDLTTKIGLRKEAAKHTHIH